MKRIIRDYCKQLQTTCQQNGQPVITGQIHRNNLPRLKHKETENINRLITSIEIETVIIKFPLYATF